MRVKWGDIAGQRFEEDAGPAPGLVLSVGGYLPIVFWTVAAFTPVVAIPMQLPMVLVMQDFEGKDKIPIPWTEFVLSLAGLLLIVTAIIAYWVHARRNSSLPVARQKRWVWAFTLSYGLALPFYWWKQIRPDAE